MKLPLLGLTIFICLTLTNCTKEESENSKEHGPTPEVYFTLKVFENYDTSNSDNWIILHDKNGELLDFRAYESGDVLIFENEPSKVTEEIAVTTFSYLVREGETRHTLKTYLDVQKGSVWNFKPFTRLNYYQLLGEQIGDFDVTISNIPEPFSFEASDKSGILSDIENFRINPPNTTTKKLKLFEKSKEHLFSVFDGNGTFKYTFVDNVQSANNLSLDYSNFKEFDNFTNVNVPPNGNFLAEIYGFENDWEYIGRASFLLGSVSTKSSDINNPISLGHLTRFNKYQILILFDTEEYYYLYEKDGSVPENIIVPENQTITISNESISNFNFSTNVNFVRKQIEFEVKHGEVGNDFIETNWQIESSNSDVQVFNGSLPEEILAKYPKNGVADLEYSKIHLYLSFGSYFDYLEKRFVSTESYGEIRSQELVTFYK